MAKEKSEPNPEIDAAIKRMLEKLKPKKLPGGQTEDQMPPDIAVKIINTAIAWEKVKHHIRDGDDPFNPDDL